MTCKTVDAITKSETLSSLPRGPSKLVLFDHATVVTTLRDQTPDLRGILCK